MVELRSGICPRFVNVEDLELKLDVSSATGCSLCSENQREPEKVHQIVSTIFPEEFALLSQGMLRQLAVVSSTIFRSPYLQTTRDS